MGINHPDGGAPTLSSPPSPLAKTSSSPTTKRPREDEDNVEAGPPPSKKLNVEAKPASKPSGPAGQVPKGKEVGGKVDSPPPENSRPRRKRQPPARLGDIAQPPKKKKETPAGRGRRLVFEPTFITTHRGSRLTKADCFHLLLEPAAWSTLKGHEQRELVGMLSPDPTLNTIIDSLDQGSALDIRPEMLAISNTCFRTDVAKFKADLDAGHLAKTWQAAATRAVIARAAGLYDAWKAEEAEMWWGQDGPA